MLIGRTRTSKEHWGRSSVFVGRMSVSNKHREVAAGVWAAMRVGWMTVRPRKPHLRHSNRWHDNRDKALRPTMDTQFGL